MTHEHANTPQAAQEATSRDAAALDAIQWMLCDPDWSAAMLEDIAELVRGTGRKVENQPDPADPASDGLSTWGRH